MFTICLSHQAVLFAVGQTVVMFLAENVTAGLVSHASQTQRYTHIWLSGLSQTAKNLSYAPQDYYAHLTSAFTTTLCSECTTCWINKSLMLYHILAAYLLHFLLLWPLLLILLVPLHIYCSWPIIEIVTSLGKMVQCHIAMWHWIMSHESIMHHWKSHALIGWGAVVGVASHLWRDVIMSWHNYHITSCQ